MKQLTEVTGHAAGHWEDRPSYLLSYQVSPDVPKQPFSDPQAPRKAGLNSCELTDVPEKQKCSGNGICKIFATSGSKSISFCECSRDWVDPECRTRRKSQTTAFVLAMVAGYLGLDRFYLGDVQTGMAKLATLGGCGFWWFWDVVRIGSSPVYAGTGHRVAADLPHFMYILLSVLWASGLSYLIFGFFGTIWFRHEALKRALIKAESDYHKARSAPVEMHPEENLGEPTVASYRPAVPVPGAESYYGTMMAAPQEVKVSSVNNPLSPYWVYAKAAERQQIIDSGAFTLAPGQVPR